MNQVFELLVRKCVQNRKSTLKIIHQNCIKIFFNFKLSLVMEPFKVKWHATFYSTLEFRAHLCGKIWAVFFFILMLPHFYVVNIRRCHS